MKTSSTKRQQGFTIIEVVLVLAIAGLIFLMVFVALPALQRSQRDTQRRNDVSKFVSQLTSYATNNRGSIPAESSDAMDDFLVDYLRSEDGEFNDPESGKVYKIVLGAGSNPSVGQIQYVKGAKCSGESVQTGASDRQAAVRAKLEGSGYTCQTNQ